MLVLKDALHNLSAKTVKDEYDVIHGKAILIGVVAGLMHTGYSWEEAFQIAKNHMPDDVVKDCIPPTWN